MENFLFFYVSSFPRVWIVKISSEISRVQVKRKCLIEDLSRGRRERSQRRSWAREGGEQRRKKSEEEDEGVAEGTQGVGRVEAKESVELEEEGNDDGESQVSVS